MSGITLTMTEPLYGGSGTAEEDVPNRYPIALDGRGYQIDDKGDSGIRHISIPMLRPQQDTGEKPSERSLNPEGLWRAGQDSWHRGAGQSFVDRPDSDPFRFRSSKGIDVFSNKWEISLLRDTERKVSSANTNLRLLPVGTGRLYFIDGQALKYLTDVLAAGAITPTAVTGTPAVAAQDLASDGFNVYVAYGASGVYKTDRATGVAAVYNSTISATVIDFVNGRLMVAAGPTLYNVTGAGAPAYTFTHPNSDFTWVGFSEGPNAIYAVGTSGDKSEVYRIVIKADGSGLDAPVPALPGFPDGESIRSTDSYLGFVCLGTDKGARLCTPSGETGNLTLGALIPTTSAVMCFEGQDRFIYFGMTNYDSVSTGLGRMDLRSLLAESTAAFASDLMASAQGSVLSAVTFQNRRVFSVAGSGIWAETGTKVASGTLDGGDTMYGIPDIKIGLFLAAEYRSFPSGSLHRAWVSADGGSFISVGSYDGTTALMPFPIGQVRAKRFEVRHELVRSSTDTTMGPVVTRHTLLAEPVPSEAGENIIVPILLEELENIGATRPMPRDVAGERAHFKELRSTKKLVSYQEGSESFLVMVTEYQWQGSKQTKNRKAYGGTAVLKLKVVG